jgi:hypothetical protein
VQPRRWKANAERACRRRGGQRENLRETDEKKTRSVIGQRPLLVAFQILISTYASDSRRYCRNRNTSTPCCLQDIAFRDSETLNHASVQPALALVPLTMMFCGSSDFLMVRITSTVALPSSASRYFYSFRVNRYKRAREGPSETHHFADPYAVFSRAGPLEPLRPLHHPRHEPLGGFKLFRVAEQDERMEIAVALAHTSTRVSTTGNGRNRTSTLTACPTIGAVNPEATKSSCIQIQRPQTVA